MSAEVVEAERRRDPGLTVVYRELAADPLGHLSGGHLGAAQGTGLELPPELQRDVALGQAALAEFLASDIVVVGAPMYNFTIPSQLKSWIDRITVAGQTFKYGPEGVQGLAGGKRVIIVSTRGRLDVLVNNAGVAYAGKPGAPFEERMRTSVSSTGSIENMRAIFETNVFGVAAVTQAMLPLLRETPAGRIVNVGSSAGSMTKGSDPKWEHRHVFGLAYSPSKTALNAITLAFANELEKTNIEVNVACPGYTATDLNDHRGTRTVEQGDREAVRLALIGPECPTGTFSDEDGPVPW